MKNPKLIKAPTAFLKSMEVLLDRYKKSKEQGITKHEYERSKGLSCLLCNPIGVKHNRHYHLQRCDTHKESCTKLGCPWIVILGETCDDFGERGIGGAAYLTTDTGVVDRRINQLRNWIKIYEKYIDTKTK